MLDPQNIETPAILRNKQFIIHEDDNWGFMKVEDTSYQDCLGFMAMGTQVKVKRINVPYPGESMAICISNQGPLIIDGESHQVFDNHYTITHCDEELITELGFVPKTVRFKSCTKCELRS